MGSANALPIKQRELMMSNNMYGTVTITEVDNLGDKPVKHNFSIVVVNDDIVVIKDATVISGNSYDFVIAGIDDKHVSYEVVVRRSPDFTISDYGIASISREMKMLADVRMQTACYLSNRLCALLYYTDNDYADLISLCSVSSSGSYVTEEDIENVQTVLSRVYKFLADGE